MDTRRTSDDELQNGDVAKVASKRGSRTSFGDKDVEKATGPDSSRMSIITDHSRASDLSQQVKQTARVFKVSTTVRIGGGLLALCAGMVNAIAYLHFGRFVSHMSGTLTKVGMGLQDSSVVDTGDSALLVLSFLMGSSVCGLLIGKNTIHFGLALYDFCLLGVSALLIATMALADRTVARYLASAACGLQNGMATIWGGAVIRTTHVTGLLTDVGLLIGRLVSLLMRKRCGRGFDSVDQVEAADDLSKLSVLLTLGPAFLLGAYAGSHLERDVGEYALALPASITGTAGVAYSLYRVIILHQRFFSDAEMEAVDVPANMLIDGVMEDLQSGERTCTPVDGRSSMEMDDFLVLCKSHLKLSSPVISVEREVVFGSPQHPERTGSLRSNERPHANTL